MIIALGRTCRRISNNNLFFQTLGGHVLGSPTQFTVERKYVRVFVVVSAEINDAFATKGISCDKAL